MSPSRAAGPFVIIATRSERNSASSTSCVTISAVLRSCAPEVEQHLLQLEARQRVEHAERLVEQQHLRRQREGAREADALPHAGRQLGRPLVQRVAEADQRRGSARRSPRARVAARCGVDLVDAEQHVLERGQPRQQARRLEHDAAIGARARRSPCRPTMIAAARSASMQAGDHRQHRRLAAAGVADEADELALGRASRSKSLTIDRRARRASGRSW